MWINGKEIERLGWTTVGLTGWMQSPTVQRASVPIANIHGHVPSVMSSTDARQMVVTWRAYPSSIRFRDEAVATLTDALAGRLWVRFDDAPSRVVRCVSMGVRVMPVHESAVFSVATIEATTTLMCYDVASYSSDPIVKVLGATPVEIPLGTLPSLARITLGGAWTSTDVRTITFRDLGGVSRSTLTLTAGASLVSSDYAEVLTGKRYVSKVTTTGVRTNIYDWSTEGGWVVLDPAFQDRSSSRYATLDVSAGTAQIVYRQAWGL